MLILGLKQNFLSYCPTNIKSLALFSMSLAIHQLDATKQDYVNELIIKAFSIQSLSFCQIDYATKM